MNSQKREEYLDLSDDRLAVLSQSGDDIAFNVLSARYLKAKYIKSNSSYLDSEDLIQESMFGFLNAVRTFDESRGVPFKSYASVCMRNSVNSAYVGTTSDLATEEELEDALNVKGAEDPLSRIISGERLNEVLEQCEVTLSEIEKTVIFLRASGMSYAEIGAKLNVEPKSVDNAVQRGRKKLKQALTE